MEAETQEQTLINSFCEIASSSHEEARFFLESHNWDLDAAVSTFLDDNATAADDHPMIPPTSPEYAPSRSRSRSPSPTPSRGPYDLRSRRASDQPPSGVRSLADLNQTVEDGSESDSDKPQEYYTGSEKSGMLVQDPTSGNDVDSIFNQVARSGAVVDNPQPSSSSKSFTGAARLLSGETVSAAPQPPASVNHTITFWRNGFSVDNGPLRRMDDPQNFPFLESIKRSECPLELASAGRGTSVPVTMKRRDEDYPEPVKQKVSFKGVGRTLGGTGSGTTSSSSSETQASTALRTPSPSSLVVDNSLALTSLQLRLADGTRLVSRFNFHHTIRDVRSFIDASRPGVSRNYQLQIMGFPPKQLTDLDQTIEQAGIANSVVIQKL